MRIEPGYYKIRQKEGLLEYRYHYLRVYIKERVKFLQIDAGIPTEAEKCEQDIIQDFEIVKRITPGNPIQVNRVIIDLSWEDEHGDCYHMSGRSIHQFFRIMELFPRVAKALDFKRLKE